MHTLSVFAAAFFVFYGCYYLADITLNRPVLDEQTASAEQFYRYPDYMPPGADNSAPWFLQGDTVIFSTDDYDMSFYDRDAAHLVFSYSKTDGGSGYADVARLYYPGYTARGADGKKLVIERSPEKQTIRVILEKPEDTVSVEYKGIMLWHVAEAVSLVFSAFLAVKLYFTGKRFFSSSKKQILQ